MSRHVILLGWERFSIQWEMSQQLGYNRLQTTQPWHTEMNGQCWVIIKVGLVIASYILYSERDLNINHSSNCRSSSSYWQYDFFWGVNRGEKGGGGAVIWLVPEARVNLVQLNFGYFSSRLQRMCHFNITSDSCNKLIPEEHNGKTHRMTHWVKLYKVPVFLER